MKILGVKRLGLVSLVIALGIVCGGCGTTTATANDTTTPAATTTDTTTASQTQAISTTRVSTGTATNLNTGTFTGGTDVPVGVYDVTPSSGSGNFTITNSDGTLMVNEVLGISDDLGIGKVRVAITTGDVIKIEGLSSVHFEPITSDFITAVQSVSLYSGFFMVGQDVAEGKYTVTTPSGSGNFMIFDSNGTSKTNEILGGDNGVPVITVDLVKGDIIQISGLNEVHVIPAQ